MKNKYRILHIINSLSRAGTERQLLLNISALDSSKYESHICHLNPINLLDEEVRRLGIRCFCLGLKGKSSWVTGISRLRHYIKATGIDLVHTNLTDSDIVGGIAARLSGVPVISTLASPSDNSTKFVNELHLNRVKLGLARFFHHQGYRMCADQLIAVSEYVNKSWLNTLRNFKSKITVIPRAISKEFLDLSSPLLLEKTDELRCKFSLNNSYPVLANVGRLIPHKGQTYILEAMNQILKEFPTAKLLIAGEGFLRSSFESTIRAHGLESSVLLLGSVDDVRILHLASDIFIFPSLSEGMPGALLEAAAIGKPCIVTDIDPVKEILVDRQSGFYVSQHSSLDIANAVIELSRDKALAANLGDEARKTIIAHHSIETLIKKLENLYENTIEKRNPEK